MGKQEMFQQRKDLVNRTHELATSRINMDTTFKNEVSNKYDSRIQDAEETHARGYSEGLSRYKDISNPVIRKSLASKYQGGLSRTYDYLTKQKDIETESYKEYINKYAGLYSADIARDKSMQAINEAEFNYQNSGRSGGSSGGVEAENEFYDYVHDTLDQSVDENGNVSVEAYKELSEKAYKEEGMSRSTFDSEFGHLLSNDDKYKMGAGGTEPDSEKEKYDSTLENSEYKKKNDDMEKYKQVIKSGKGVDDVEYGELYVENGVVKKKQQWWGGFDDVLYDPNN